MANSNNAYATVTPVKSSISDTMNDISTLDVAYREEQRKLKELEDQKAEKAREKQEELKKFVMGKIPKNFDTGSSSLNELNAKVIQQGVDRMGEIYTELNNPNISNEQRIKLELEAQEIGNLPTKLKLATQTFTDTINDYQEKKLKGEYFPDLDFEKKVLSGFQNYHIVLKDGNPVIAFADTNNDGTVNDLDVVPYDRIQSGVGVWNFQKQFDLDKMAVDAAKNIGYEDVTTDKNFKSVKIKKAKESSVEAVANNLLKNPDGSYTEVAMSQFRKMGVEPNESSFKTVKDYFMTRVKANTDFTKEENVDYSSQQSRMEYNDDKKKEEIQRIVSVFDGKNGYDDFVKRQTSTDKVKPNMISIPDGQLKFNNIGGAKSGLNNGYITGFALANDGKIIVTGKALIDKGKKFKVGGNEMDFNKLMDSANNGNTEAQAELDAYSTPSNYGNFIRYVNDTDLSGYARKAGYKNSKDLLLELKKMNKNIPQNKQSSTKKTIKGF